MKEIKFRAWNKTLKVMGSALPLDVLTADIAERPEAYHQDWHNLVLMQFTGLKDKNGKEIYEGDILADADEPETCIHRVFWDNDKLAFNILTLADDEGNWDTGLYDDLGDGQVNGETKHFEVIGNIYENQNLLQGN